MTMKKINLCAGLLGMAAFAMTGAYMHVFLDHLQGIADGPRLMHRTAHIYVLWSALLNVVVGTSPEPRLNASVRWMLVASSIMIATTPALIVGSFFAESFVTSFYRPLARLAIYLASVGGVLRAVVMAQKQTAEAVAE